jgi:hypothetical protein
MHTPTLTASRALQAPGITMAALPGMGDFSPAIDFGCLLGCGAQALPCIRCGTDLLCWASCAGPSTVSCITKCL